MRLLVCFLGMASLLCADTLRVSVIDNEVWLTRNAELSSGRSTQLTHDGKAKIEAELSAHADRVAYYEECPEQEHCTPTVVILDLEGRRLQSFQPRVPAIGSPEPCASILRISWLRDDTAMGVECHRGPSSSLYVETDLATGKTVRELAGLAFTTSPDGKVVAHVGPLMHFAPPFAQSHYLLFDNTVVYPLPKGEETGGPETFG